MNTINVELDLNESGFICNLLLRHFHECGGAERQPRWAVALYTKLATANDKLMFPDIATDESRSYGPHQ